MQVSLNIESSIDAVGGAGPQGVTLRQEDVSDFRSLMGSGLEGVGRAAEAASAKYEHFTRDLMRFGERIDLRSPATVVHALDHQMKVSLASVQFQFALEAAGATKNAFRTLYQQQA